MPSDWLLVPEAAAYARTSIDTVRTWIAKGMLPSSRPGRRRLVRKDDLDAFLQRDVQRERRGKRGGPAPEGA